jgi:hypothetical protein
LADAPTAEQIVADYFNAHDEQERIQKLVDEVLERFSRVHSLRPEPLFRWAFAIRVYGEQRLALVFGMCGPPAPGERCYDYFRRVSGLGQPSTPPPYAPREVQVVTIPARQRETIEAKRRDVGERGPQE